MECIICLTKKQNTARYSGLENYLAINRSPGWYDLLDLICSDFGSRWGLKTRCSMHYYLIKKLGHEVALWSFFKKDFEEPNSIFNKSLSPNMFATAAMGLADSFSRAVWNWEQLGVPCYFHLSIWHRRLKHGTPATNICWIEKHPSLSFLFWGPDTELLIQMFGLRTLTNISVGQRTPFSRV